MQSGQPNQGSLHRFMSVIITIGFNGTRDPLLLNLSLLMASNPSAAYSENGPPCAYPLDPNSIELILALMTSVGLVSVLLCTTAIVLVLVLRLYRSLVYRLAAYQVLTALVYGKSFALCKSFPKVIHNPTLRFARLQPSL